MYINRKKRSVKWVVDGDEDEQQQSYSYQSTRTIENGKDDKTESTEISSSSGPKKMQLKLVMNPQGQMRDFSELEKADTVPNIPIMSPEPIINALHTPKEKGETVFCCFCLSNFTKTIFLGAELFAKRRKKSDKWVIDETNSESFLKSQKSSKYTNSVPPTPTLQAPIDNAAIDSISKSINDLKPISSASDSKPSTPATSLPPPNYISTTKVN